MLAQMGLNGLKADQNFDVGFGVKPTPAALEPAISVVIQVDLGIIAEPAVRHGLTVLPRKFSDTFPSFIDEPLS